MKKYEEKTVLNDINFVVKKGEFLCLLGPNGAGKTTLIKILTGQIRPTSGEARVLGNDVSDILKADVKVKISYVPQEDLIWNDLTVEENLNLMGKLYGFKKNVLKGKVEQALRDFNLWEHRKKFAEKLSGGMKRKLSVAMSLINDPELLFLDEPTTGLDVIARTMLIEDLKRLKERKLTVVLTTHLMEEAELLSSRVIMLSKGRIVKEGTVEELIKATCGEKILQIGALNDGNKIEEYLNNFAGIKHTKIKNTFFVTGNNLSELMHKLSSNKELQKEIMELTLKQSRLREAFLFSAGEELKELENYEKLQGGK